MVGVLWRRRETRARENETTARLLRAIGIAGVALGLDAGEPRGQPLARGVSGSHQHGPLRLYAGANPPRLRLRPGELQHLQRDGPGHRGRPDDRHRRRLQRSEHRRRLEGLRRGVRPGRAAEFQGRQPERLLVASQHRCGMVDGDRAGRGVGARHRPRRQYPAGGSQFLQPDRSALGGELRRASSRASAPSR